MKARRHPTLATDELREHEPDGLGGSYPPDVAARRRRLGLPVTPAEHASYARGETLEPPVTRTQMAATLRAVLPRIRPGSGFREVLVVLATRHLRAVRDPGEEG